MPRPGSTAFLARLRRELRRGVLPVWILEELRAGPTYGYALLERLRERLGDPAGVGPSTLYPALDRLRAAGLVRVFHGTVSQGPIRKYYALTDSGLATLPVALGMLSGGHRSSERPAPPELPSTRSVV